MRKNLRRSNAVLRALVKDAREKKTGRRERGEKKRKKAAEANKNDKAVEKKKMEKIEIQKPSNAGRHKITRNYVRTYVPEVATEFHYAQPYFSFSRSSHRVVFRKY